ncbi:hypothetical protein [Mesorhizobium ventifaucium]|uniref:Uncharacterized protein n=1 Tax=Mesorhizobium ventifaucium TaxID=666020 RepID=A0ABN8JEJ8_9HYPH|nr:hypothetical protein [Mesorhizobium ventifaucium]CAH2395633.1 hypothetical protein MES4922_130059 [Mesorhizobium ventifaucium]
MFPSAGRKPVRPGGQPVTPNRLPGRPQRLGLPALYLMLHGNPALEPIVATGSMIVAASVLIFAFVVFSAETARSVSGIPAVPR